jgi:hypothetical protein
MSFTRGGDNKNKRFEWYFDSESQGLNIKNEDRREHFFRYRILMQYWVQMYPN